MAMETGVEYDFEVRYNPKEEKPTNYEFTMQGVEEIARELVQEGYFVTPKLFVNPLTSQLVKARLNGQRDTLIVLSNREGVLHVDAIKQEDPGDYRTLPYKFIHVQVEAPKGMGELEQIVRRNSQKTPIEI